jgi:hypothetical protein
MRNYHTITEDEQAIYIDLAQKEVVYNNGKPTLLRKSLYNKYPKAVRHYLSLFPNKLLDRVDLLGDQNVLISILNGFKLLLDASGTSEQEIQKFIKDKEAYFIIGAILKTNYRFGHHGLFVFPEFPLTINFKVDYLIIGKNSHGYHFVFVEFENPTGAITNKDGTYGNTIRKGIKQVEDWSKWLEKNYSHLKPVFDKEKKRGVVLPEEFVQYDSTRMHYVVVAGRRTDYTSEAQYRNRDYLKQRNIQVLHFDNILDEALNVIETFSY